MSNESFLTQADIDVLRTSGLKTDVPFLIRHISKTQFSIARHFGAMNYNGNVYSYLPVTDEAIRDDALKFVMKERSVVQKKIKQLNDEAKRKNDEMTPTLF